MSRLVGDSSQPPVRAHRREQWSSTSSGTNPNLDQFAGHGKDARIIRAVYGGSATVLPTTAQASVNVPTKIKLSVSSRAVPWTGVLVLHGHLEGGYVPPPDGVALRLLIRLPGHSHPYEPVPFRTDAAGNFTIRWTWGRGFGVATYPFAVATTATESDVPVAASRSRWIPITFGVSRGTTTTTHQQKQHHHKRHRRHRGSS